MCPNDTYIMGAEVKYEDIGHSDDTTFNGLKIRCAHPATFNIAEDKLVDEGAWGTWRGFKETPKKYDFWVGAQIRYDDILGPGHDDTAMNGLRAFYKKFDTNHY